jgi:hypothetical protein
MFAALSYFHARLGPTVFYSYPKNLLTNELSKSINSMMDQYLNITFFTHSEGNLNILNHYFEIPSLLNPRGRKEMLMVSIIFEQQLSLEMRQTIFTLLKDFSNKLEANSNLYVVFHNQDSMYLAPKLKEEISNNTSLIKLWVKELYWAIFEIIREKTEMEKIAFLFSQKYIYSSLKKLSERLITLDEFEEWFTTTFLDKDFHGFINQMLQEQLIIINQIGRFQKYILLSKELNIERIPPEFIIEYFDETPELMDLIIPKIQKFFNEYEKKTQEELEEDRNNLIQILADSKKFTLLSKLKEGLIARDQLPKLFSKKELEKLWEIIDYLKQHDIIEELKYNNERYIVLKTYLQMYTTFPEYMKRLLITE